MQLNLRVSEEFFQQAKQYAKVHGFLNIQELFREAVRKKIFEEDQVRTDYLERLNCKEASTFLSEQESEESFKKSKKIQ